MLTGLYLIISGRIDFETELLCLVIYLSDIDILEWNNPARLFVSRELKIIQTTIVENEPAAFPVLVATSLLPQPALANRVEECEHEVVAIVHRYLEGLSLDAVVAFFEHRLLQLYLTCLATHFYELVTRLLVFDTRIV